MPAERADLVIAGGGPVGLATAIRARQAGLDVIVLERRRPPIDAACGEGLLPDGVVALEALGVAPRGWPFAGLRFIDGDRVAEGRFPIRPALGIRRTELHRELAARAGGIGVRLHWGLAAEGLTEAGFRTQRGLVEGRFLVAADGRSSRVRGWAGLEGRPARARRVGVRRHFRVAPWTDVVEVHWGDGAEAYVTPVGQDTVGVALLASAARGARFDDLLDDFPALRERLAGAEPVSADRGAAMFHLRARRAHRGRLALVGDAAGCLDPISGEGLALGFRSALALVDGIVAGDLAAYERSRVALARPARLLTALLTLAAAHAPIRRRMMAALAGRGDLMTRFLAAKAERGGRERGPGTLIRLAVSTLVGAH